MSVSVRSAAEGTTQALHGNQDATLCEQCTCLIQQDDSCHMTAWHQLWQLLSS